MKKYLVILFALLAFVGTVHAQGRDARFSDGITRGAYPAIGLPGTGDSSHYVGRFFLRNNDRTPWDSLTFAITNTDSLRFGVLVKYGTKGHTTDTIRVVTQDGAANATHYVQKTVAGVTHVKWSDIITATGGKAQSAQFIDLYLWIYKVGTETPGSTLSGDTVTIFPKAYD
jgi:hypothetical protein